MSDSTVPNPNEAFGRTGAASYRPRSTVECLNSGSADIAEGDVVTLYATITASQGFAVKQADVSADDPATVIGVAAEAIASGASGQVVTSGYAVVNVDDSSSITAGQVAQFHATTDGAAANVTADATTIAGDSFAVFLGAEDLVGTDQAPVNVVKV